MLFTVKYSCLYFQAKNIVCKDIQKCQEKVMNLGNTRGNLANDVLSSQQSLNNNYSCEPQNVCYTKISDVIWSS